MANKTKVVVGDQDIYIGVLTPLQRLEAEEIYREFLTDASYMEMMSSQQMLDYLQDVGLWSVEEERFLDDLPNLLEQMKVEMYNNYIIFRSKMVEKIRKGIDDQIEKGLCLASRRHSYDMYTCEGFAVSCKLQYSISVAATDKEGNKIDLYEDVNLLQNTINAFLNSPPSEAELRELARTNPWRDIWNAGKVAGQIFDCSALMLSDTQRQLLSWSQLYDNVRESPDAPNNDVVEDDYMLDGWLIAQSRKAKEEKQQQGGLSTKMQGAGEVFIPVESASDAERVHQMNSAQARMAKRQKLRMVGKEGIVPEQQMPEAQIQLRQKAVEQIKNRAQR
jgi:hypothetical protein